MEHLNKEQATKVMQCLYEQWADQNNQIIDSLEMMDKEKTEDDTLVGSKKH